MNTTAPVRTSFLRICKDAYVKGLLKEAKRVDYTVVKNGDFDFTVTDPEHDNSMVFTGVPLGRGLWSVRFSKVYWQEPTI